MDRTEIEKVIELVRDAKNSLPPGGTRGVLVSAYYALEDALAKIDNPDSGRLDECECEGCRAKTAEEVKQEPTNTDNDCKVVDGGYEGHAPDRAMQLTFHADQPSDYEIRLKAWNLANDCMWETAVDDFAATLDAAKKLYNFLSGQNEGAK